MQRTVSAHLELELSGNTDMVFSIAAAAGARFAAESLSFVLGGRESAHEPALEPAATELTDRHGTRLHTFAAGPGTLIVDYTATVDGRVDAEPVSAIDTVTYLRPSRYCESDLLLQTARSEFAGLYGHELLAAVTDWVATRIRYVPGSSAATHSAADTLLARRGVCRDFAHLVIALLRARDVPARMVAVYAPGLAPMDFHAVAEAFVDGQWWVVDATRLAPRQSMLRIATGRDASDISFLTNHWADLTLTRLTVMATADELPVDDFQQLVQLG